MPNASAAREPLPAPFDRRVQLFTGKGGVGKTSVVAGLAVEAARRGHRPLIVELGHRASVPGIVAPGSPQEVGYQPVEVLPGVFAMNMSLDDALEDYITAQVRVRRVARAITQSQALRRFFHAAPAVNEVVTLHRLSRLAAAPAGRRESFSPILVDLDATGHALMFLELPRVFEGLASSGPLRALLDGFSRLLRDEQTTVLHLVALPLELPAQETQELYEQLRHDPHSGRTARVPLGALILNGVPTEPLTEEELQALPALEERAPQLAPDIALARRAQQAAQGARRVGQELLGRVPLVPRQLPRLSGALGPPELARLGALLLGGAQ
jgi:anion-transporting  ArsA/GET3 family ATPase